MNETFLKNCLCTYTHTPLDPIAPAIEHIKSEDIAHALSLMCRSNGHVRQFYSVAQHSLNCADEAEARGWGARVALACLLHDASEAYIADIIRPVKHHLSGYLEIESALQNAVWARYGLTGLTDAEQEQIRVIDDRILRCEFIEFFDLDLDTGDSAMRSVPDFALRPFDEVEREFLARLDALCAGCAEGSAAL